MYGVTARRFRYSARCMPRRCLGFFINSFCLHEPKLLAFLRPSSTPDFLGNQMITDRPAMAAPFFQQNGFKAEEAFPHSEQDFFLRNEKRNVLSRRSLSGEDRRRAIHPRREVWQEEISRLVINSKRSFVAMQV